MENKKFGVVSSEKCPLDDLVEVASDLVSDVSGQICTESVLDVDILDHDLDLATNYLKAAEAALTILDNPDWTNTLLQVRSGMVVTKRLTFCLNVIEVANQIGLQIKEDPFVVKITK